MMMTGLPGVSVMNNWRLSSLSIFSVVKDKESV